MDGVVNGQLPSKGAIDIALHDLIGKALGIPVWRLLGGSNEKPVIVEGPGYGIGFMKPEAAVELALKGISGGCRQIEVKCGHPSGPEHDLAVIARHGRVGDDEIVVGVRTDHRRPFIEHVLLALIRTRNNTKSEGSLDE
jgi:L-alanine-DL-glutamate epimerase-like enolase superfamily enzyme